MSTILVNNVKSYTGGTVNISGSSIDIDGAVDIDSTLTLAGNADFNGALDVDGTTNLDVVDIDGAVDMASTLTLAGNADFNGQLDVSGTTNLDVVDIDGAVDMASTLTLAGNADFNGQLDVSGTTNLDVVDIDGAVDMASTLIVNNVATITTASFGVVSSSIIPQADNTFDLGSSTKQYKTLHTLSSSLAHISVKPGFANITVSGSTIFEDGVTIQDNLTVIGDTTINGNLTFGDSTSDSVNFGAEISSSIIPDADNIYNLGSDAKQWKELHAKSASLAYIGVKPGFANITISGSTIFQDGVTIQGTTDFNGNTTFDGVLTTITTASFGVVSSSIIPNADNAFDLGSAAYQWNEGHITTASIAHLQSKAGTVIYVSGNLTPRFPHDDKFDLGSSVAQWKDLYVDGIANLDHISAGTLTLDQNITTAAATDAAHYIINGKRGEIRSRLQSSVAADTGFTLQLRNTSIAANSLIVANVIAGGDGGIITGSVVTANVIAANTASFNFFNTGNAALANNAIFTASFAIF